MFDIFLNKARISELLLCFKCLEKFSENKISELEELKKKFEVYVHGRSHLFNLMDSFIIKEVTSCNLNTYQL